MDTGTIWIILSFLLGGAIASLVWWLVGFIKEKMGLKGLILGVVSFIVNLGKSHKYGKKRVKDFISGLSSNGGTITMKLGTICPIPENSIVWRYVDYKVNKKANRVEFMLINGDIGYLPFYVITSNSVGCEIENKGI